MKTVRAIILLTVVTLLSCSCLSRTVSSDAPLGKEGSVIEKKIVWIWQDDFHNP
jgi:hypothetical protein